VGRVELEVERPHLVRPAGAEPRLLGRRSPEPVALGTRRLMTLRQPNLKRDEPRREQSVTTTIARAVTRHSRLTSAGFRRCARRRLLSRAIAAAAAAAFLCTMPASAARDGLAGPTRPGKLKIRSISATVIHVSWGASHSNVRVTGYRIYVNGVLRASVRSRSFRVRRLRCGRKYVLAVRAYDSAGRGSPSRFRTVRTLRCSPGRTAPQRCTKTTRAGTGLVSAIQNASAGSTICLASGTYTGFTLTSVSKSSDVTIKPASGASVTISGGVNFNKSSHLRFTGVGGTMTIHGNKIDNSSGCSSHLSFDHITYTSGVIVLTRYACSHHLHLLWDHDRFDNLGSATWEGRFNVESYDVGPLIPNGVTISNSHFGGSGPSRNNCSDGIEPDAYGTVIGPGNEFTNLKQGSCIAHVDPIQIYGGSHTIVTGNYFHDNGDGSGGMMAGAYADYTTVSNNVFVCSCRYPWSIHAGSERHSVIKHNTFAGGGEVRFEVVNGVSPSGDLVRDNVFTRGGGISTDGSNYGTNHHNLNAGRPGMGNMTGTPIFVGGKKPTSYAGYHLAPRSRGKGAASDGGDMGIRPRR
jgi:hypothetical protein